MKRTLYIITIFALLTLLLATAVCAAEYTEGAESGLASDEIFARVLIGFAIGFVIAVIVTVVMVRKMSTVRRARSADPYVVKNSFSLTESRDIYLYSRVTRVRVNTNKKN